MTRAAGIAIAVALTSLQPAAQERSVARLPPAVSGPVDFVRDVQPILEASCARCHARGRAKGGFSIESRETLLKGGDNGPAIVPGKSEVSELVALVAGLDRENVMPQKGSRLTAGQIGILRAWIDQGAAWPEAVSLARAAPRNLERRRPVLPPMDRDSHPIDRLLETYFAAHGDRPAPRAEDRVLVRRVYLDVIGQLPPPSIVRAFVDDRRPDKWVRLVRRLMADRAGYAEHWLTFWNDQLRNDYRGTGYIDDGRQQITRWLYAALVTNMPFDRFVSELVNPVPGSEGFSKGIVWRGVVNASQTPEMQAAQNISQVFMGVNLKCASCHDSFVSDWQLADAYGMAGIYADDALPMVECDRPTGRTAPVRFLYPQVGTIDATAPKGERVRQLAAALTSERNGRLSRTFINRLWARLMGRGLVEPLDDMERQAWDPELLDWLAEDFVASGYDVKAAIERMLTSEAYQRVAVDVPERVDKYTFLGPAIRRMSAEQFVDAISAVTGVWQDAPAGDFDFTVAGIAGPRVAGRWIVPVAADAGAWVARRSFRLDAVPASAHILLGTERPYMLYVNGFKAAEQKKAAAARLIDIRSHLQPGANVLAVAVGAPLSPPGAPGVNATRTAADGGALFAQVLVRRRLAASAPVDTVTASNHAWRTSPAPPRGWEAPAFDDRRWTRAVEQRLPQGREDESQAAVTRALATAARFGHTRAALTYADPLTTALGRPSREQVITSRVAPATTLQSLELLNGDTLATFIQRGAEAVAAERGASARRVIDRLYMRALGRRPTPAEASACLALLGPTVKPTGVEDVLWAIVMLPEFQLIF